MSFQKDFSKKNFFTNNYKNIKNCNFFIVCVPTPITLKNIPDLRLLIKVYLYWQRYFKMGILLF